MQEPGARGQGRGLRIPRALYEEIVAHGQSRYPKEACGLLAGPADGAWRAVQVYPMRNVEDSPVGYSMDPPQQLRVEQQMRSRSQRLIAIYHSHTASAAYPSPVDVNRAISPDVSYVLVSLQDQGHPVVRSFRIDGAAIAEEPITVNDL